jgi:CRP/FNR family cyclic AMP-dependent transcriptional regulator
MRTRVPKKELDLLAQVPLFSTCTQRELRSIAQLGTELEVPAGKVLTRRGAPAREFFLVLEGKAECTVDTRKVAMFGPGDYFGELALIEGGPRTATVTAETPMSLLVLDAGEFSSLMESAPSITPKLLNVLARRLRQLQDSYSL